MKNHKEEEMKFLKTDGAVGKGRLLECLKKNDQKVSQRCKQALEDVGATK